MRLCFLLVHVCGLHLFLHPVADCTACVLSYCAHVIPFRSCLQVDERQIGDRLCTNLTAVSKWQQHTRVFGIGSQPLAALQAAAAGAADEEGGSSVTLVAHACFPGWCNHVSDAQIECFLAPRLKAS